MKTPKPTDRPAGSPEKPGPDAGAEAAVAEPTATPSKPPPEPMTPERVLEWNAYYDLFVAGFALLLCFVAAATIIDNPVVWSHLRTGQLIDQNRGPITVEPFSYAVPEGTPWVNVPWIFQWASYHVHELGRSLADALDQPENRDRYGAAALVAVSASLRVLAALLLLLIRRPGPGLWWASVTTALAFGAVLTPLGGTPLRLAIGGMVGMGSIVSPNTWGLLLLAVMLLLLHWSYNLGRSRAIYGLVPLFALWANVDITFSIGLLVAAACVVGSGIRPGRPTEKEATAPGLGIGLIVLALSALACVANPSTFAIFDAGFMPLVDVFRPAPDALMQEQVTLLPFGSRGELSRTLFFRGEYGTMVGYYMGLLFLGLLSFLLNRRRFDLGRLLMFLMASVVAALLWRNQDVMAVVLATCLALNGQEWYHDTFGVQGSLKLGWRLWSVTGRLLTILLLTLASLAGLTGYGKRFGEPPFGFGLETDRFAFEAADFLRDAPIEGRVMNLRLSLGDALNWRSYPNRQSFADNRLPRSVVPELLSDYDRVRTALVENDVETWREVLDRHGVSVLMVDIPSSGSLRSLLTDALDASPDWIGFYDDGLALLYGRLDRSEAVSQADREFFGSQRLDAEAIAFGRGNPPRPFDRPPRPTDVLDRFSNTRALAPIQPHVLAARRWLDRGARAAGSPDAVPAIAYSLLAIQECRDALSVRPDDPDAYFVLSIAYRFLAQQEAELLVASGNPSVLSGETTSPMRLRQLQRITVLNSFVQTVPKPPSNDEARLSLRGAHLELAGVYEASGLIDLTRDHLREAITLFDSSEIVTEEEAAFIEGLRTAVENLTEQVERIRVQLEEAEIEGQLDLAQLGNAAIGQGLAESAIDYMRQAVLSGVGLATVRTQLVDLLCDVGRPDQAIEFLSGDEMGMAATPGAVPFRQGRVYFLMGDYRTSADLWRNLSIPQLRASRSQEALQTATLMTTGQPMAAIEAALGVPRQLRQQADWEYLLGVTLLEGGTPSEAGEPLRSSLELDPDLPGRPIVEHYLDRLGVDLPSADEDEPDPEPSAADSPADSADPAPAPAEPDPPSDPAPSDPAPSDPEPTTDPEPSADPEPDDGGRE